MRSLGAGLILLWRFGVEVVCSGATTAWWILRPGQRPQPGLVRMRYHGLSETGAVVLGCLVTLTQGTTIVDVDSARGELLLHLLDASAARATAASIRRTFEAPLRLLHPASRST